MKMQKLESLNTASSSSFELTHLYGENFHIVNDAYSRSRLAWLSQTACKQPEFNQIVSELYYQLVRYVIAKEFPTIESRVETRMSSLSPFGIWEGEVIDPNTRVVSVNIARAGSLPSQICFDACNFILNPDLVRQDHMYMARKTDTDGKVVGVDFSGNKVGGSIEDSIVLFPDPMGATGSSLVEAINFYKREAVRPLKLISLHLVISPEFIRKIKAEQPDLLVYAFRIDRGASSIRAKSATPGEFLDEESGLTDIQYIVPGLGGLGELINNSYC